MTLPHKYLRLAQIYFQSILEYRVNFLVWRLRNFIGLATVFMIWQAVFANQQTVHSYHIAEIYSYVIFGNLFSSLVSSRKLADLQGVISSGSLNEFLLKPVNIISYFGVQEFTDKILNICFTIIELLILYFIFTPEIVFSSSLLVWLVLALFVPVAASLNFLVNLSISLTTFWYYQNGGWGQRFLADLVIGFFSGSYFPLEFFPKLMSVTLMTLPTSLFFYTPMQLFLGRISPTQGIMQLLLGLGWIVVFYLITRILWQQGLRQYEAFGS